MRRRTVLSCVILALMLLAGLTPSPGVAASLDAAAEACPPTATNTVKAAGNNSGGQLGVGTTLAHTTLTAVTGMTGVQAIAAGEGHSLALAQDGTVRAWGDNTSRQLGDGSNIDRLTATTVLGLGSVTAVAAGSHHSLALLQDGTVRAWGMNDYGQLGDDSTTDRPIPVTVSGLSGVVAIGAGRQHSVALLRDGTVRAWGGNYLGQLGIGSTEGATAPVTVNGLTNVVAIAVGHYHNLAVLADGTVKAWGENTSGHLGDGTKTTRLAPVTVVGLTTAVAVAAGSDHSLALLANGTVAAWGWGDYGQIGNGKVVRSQLTPTPVSTLTDVTAITAGYDTNLAIRSDGTVWGWGGNDFGQLGDGTTTEYTSPVQIKTASSARAVSGGGRHSLVLEGAGAGLSQPTPAGTLTANVARQATIGLLGAHAWQMALTAGQKVRITVTGGVDVLHLMGPDGQVVTVGARRVAGPGAFGTSATIPASGVYRVVVRDTDQTGGAYTVTAAPLASSLGELAWYFAEGYTGAGFDEFLTIQNPNAQAANLTITYFLTDAAPVVKTLTVAGNSRDTVVVHEGARGVGRGQAVSALIESTNGVGIVAERPMYFAYTDGQGRAADGGHNTMGVTSPRQSWLFAEGYTGTGFDEYLTILNANSTAAETRITYFLAQGDPVVKTIGVPARSRYTVAVHGANDGVGRDQAVSAQVTTTHPGGIVVERPMYFTYGGSLGGVTGGHTVMGAAGPRSTWYFPDGNTQPGNDDYLTLMNPSCQDAAVRLTYYVAGDVVPRSRTITVAANSRRTVAVHEDSLVGRGHRLGTKVETTNGVNLVVERPRYFRHSGIVNGGHTIMGALAPARTWLFAEGYTGDGFDQELVVLNPSNQAIHVDATYYRGAGVAPVTRRLALPPNSRVAFHAHDAAEGVGRGQAISAKVEAVEANATIVVERPIYFAYSPTVNGGHTVMGYVP